MCCNIYSLQKYQFTCHGLLIFSPSTIMTINDYHSYTILFTAMLYTEITTQLQKIHIDIQNSLTIYSCFKKDSSVEQLIIYSAKKSFSLEGLMSIYLQELSLNSYYHICIFSGLLFFTVVFYIMALTCVILFYVFYAKVSFFRQLKKIVNGHISSQKFVPWKNSPLLILI